MRVKPLSVGVRALIEDDAGRILLIKHTYVPGWHFPGGGVEPGET
ncbi:MAG: NUDIX domain-containing protein, partial [Pseudomonadota bacterium]